MRMKLNRKLHATTRNKSHSLLLSLSQLSVPHICMYDCLSVRQTHWHNNEEGNPRRRRHRLRWQLGRQLHDPQDEIETSCRCPKLVASVLGYGCRPTQYTCTHTRTHCVPQTHVWHNQMTEWHTLRGWQTFSSFTTTCKRNWPRGREEEEACLRLSRPSLTFGLVKWM